MKKLLSLLLVMCLGITLAVGCGKSSPTSSNEDNNNSTSNEDNQDNNSTSNEDKQKITIWAWDPNFNIAIMNKAKDLYTANNSNVEIDIVDIAKSDLEQKLHTNLASGLTTDLPDIVLIEDYNAQKYLQAYPGSFEPLTNKINYDDFANYKVELMTVDGEMYGVPFDSGASGMYYRKDYLEEAGYTSDDLENITWDEYIAIAQDMYNKTGRKMLSTDPNDGGLMRIMLNTTNQWYFDAEGNVNVADNEAMKEAARIYSEICNADFTKITTGWSEWVGAINTGDVATITTGVWITGSVKAEESQSGLWRVAPTPRLNVEGAVNASNLGGSSWYVLSSSKSKDAAIDFLSKTYDQNTDFYQEILIDKGAVGSYIPSQSGSAYSAQDPFFDNQVVFGSFSQWMQKIPSINYGLYTYEADAAIMKYMFDVYSGKLSIDDALKKAEEQLLIQIQE